MKKSLLAAILFLNTFILFAQQTSPTATTDPELTDLFLTYWPVVLLPVFMIVIWRVYRGRSKK